MKTVAALAAVAIGAAVAYTLRRESRGQFGEAVGRTIMRRMEHMMASLPEGAPPKLVMSILPQLKVQNERIIALLEEQNELLRKQLKPA